MRNLVVFALDHVLSASWRRDALELDWDQYQEDCINDAIVEDTVNMANALNNSRFCVIGVTSRPHKFWPASMAWLTINNIELEDLLMRPDDDFSPGDIVKLNQIAAYCGGEDKIKDKVALFIDAHQKAIEVFNGIGVTTLHVNARRD